MTKARSTIVNVNDTPYYHCMRSDNLVCAAVINDESIIIKTIMINWQLRGVK